MVDVSTRTVIACPIEQVWNFASDPDNAPKWYVNIKSATWKTAKPLRLGSQIAFNAQFLGRELSYVYEIVELVPPRKLLMRTSDGPFPMETTYVLEASDQRATQMTLRNRGNPSGFSKLFAPFMSMMMKRENTKDLKRLKAIVEQLCT